MSEDMYVVADGQKTFRQEVLLRLDAIDGRLDRIESRVGQTEQALVVLHEDVSVLRARQDMLIWTVGIGFSLMAAFIAFVGIFVPAFTSRKADTETKPQPEVKPAEPTPPSELVKLINAVIDSRRLR